MKKLISLGIVSTMVASLASVACAVSQNTYNGDLTAYALKDKNTSLATAKTSVKNYTSKINGIDFSKENLIYVEGSKSDTFTVVFGASTTLPLGVNTSAYSGDVIIASTGSSDFAKANHGAFSNAGSRFVSKSTSFEVNAGNGIYKKALGFKFEITNTTSSDKYAAYTLTVKNSNKTSAEKFTLVVKALAAEKDNVGNVDGDVNDDGYVEYSSGTAVKNGHVIYTAALKEMYNKGTPYVINFNNGVSVMPSKISKKTYEDGNLTLNYNVGRDGVLVDRYAEAAGANPITLDVISGFVNEKVKYNIKVDDTEVLKTITDSQQDKWSDGKKVYVYVVNKANLETAANASAADGLVNSEKMIVGKIADSKIAFEVPANYFDITKEKLMVCLKELDIAKLPVIPGVSSTDETAAANEITAPVISETSAPVVAPSVVSTPVLTSVATTNKGAQNTGASDVIVLAIALATISMAAAGTVAFKKF